MPTFAHCSVIPRKLPNWKGLFTSLSVCRLSFLAEKKKATETNYGIGLDPPFNGVFRTAQKDVTVASLSIKQNERLFLNIAGANLEVNLKPVHLQYNLCLITSC